MKHTVFNKYITLALATILLLFANFKVSAQIPDYNIYYWNLSKGNINFTPGSAEGWIWNGSAWVEASGSTYALTNAVMWIVMDPGNKFNGNLSSLAEYQHSVTKTTENLSGNINIVNNPDEDVAAVLKAWNRRAEQVGRPSTNNWISVACNQGYSIVLDNIWSTYQEHSQGSTQGGLAFKPQSNQYCVLNVVLKGDNRFGNIFYSSRQQQYPGGPEVSNWELFTDTHIIFKSWKGAGAYDGTLTVGNIDPDARYHVDDTNGDVPYNFYNSVIGGSDSHEDALGIQIDGGTIYAGAQPEDVCSAIGGGGNGVGGVTINGGQVTAVTSSTGTAIGGGIGWTDFGGQANVTITGGKVFAYNKGIVRDYDGDLQYVPAAAIGGGSSFKKKCKETTVTITGGEVHAESVGGVAIGGGGSGFGDGGNANITISGANTTIWAKSISNANDPNKLKDIPAGSSIGGGVGGIGPLNDSDLASNGPGNGGNCTFTMTSGTLRAGSVGGGSTNPKNSRDDITVGKADVTIGSTTESAPDIRAQFIMAKGAAVPSKFTMHRGTIHNNDYENSEYYLVKKDGGAVWMDDPDGDVHIYGGQIMNCNAKNGGAVYTTGGSVVVENATIQDCKAKEGDGGAIAVMSSGATVTLNKAKIINNTAKKNGGAFYLSPNATVTITNGTIDDNHATTEDGGAFYGSAGSKITLNSGSIERNTARNGAGVYLASGAELTYTTSPTVKGYIRQNHASGLGGGVYLAQGSTSDKTELDFIMNSSTSFGFYDNLADVGADDIYAYGQGTTRIEFPSVNGMDLGGYSLFGATLQWWEDYKVNDNRYSVGTLQGDPNVIRRYRASRDALEPIWRVPKVSTEALSNFYEKYLCLTLGFEYGNLEIRRSGLEPRENAIYKIEFVGTELDRPTQYVTVLGTTEEQKTTIDGVAWNIAKVGFLPQGSYKVTEIPWAWYNETTTPTATVKTQDISNEEGRIFRFQNTHIDLGTTPQHDEELKVNDLKP